MFKVDSQDYLSFVQSVGMIMLLHEPGGNKFHSAFELRVSPAFHTEVVAMEVGFIIS